MITVGMGEKEVLEFRPIQVLAEGLGEGVWREIDFMLFPQQCPRSGADVFSPQCASLLTEFTTAEHPRPSLGRAAAENSKAHFLPLLLRYLKIGRASCRERV